MSRDIEATGHHRQTSNPLTYDEYMMMWTIQTDLVKPYTLSERTFHKIVDTNITDHLSTVLSSLTEALNDDLQKNQRLQSH
jgi:hypothetical protein